MQISIHDTTKIEITETRQQSTGAFVKNIRVTSVDWKGNESEMILTLFADNPVETETVESIY